VTHFKKIAAVMMIGVASHGFASDTSTTTFDISPAVTAITLSSDGSTSVLYTITNNWQSPASIPGISVTPGYDTAGQNLSIQSSTDTCDGATLAPRATCTFRVIIPGANQPSSFTLNPRVCGFYGATCSYAQLQPVAVSVYTPLFPTRAYEQLDTSGTGYQLVGINVANTSDIIRTSLSAFISSNTGAVAVSNDGSTVYVAGNTVSGPVIQVYTVSASSLTLSKTINLTSTTDSFDFAMALTPDSTKLFIAAKNTTNSNKSNIYSVKTSSGSVTTLASNVSLLVGTNSVVASPDGTTVYISTNYPSGSGGTGILAFSTTATSVSSSDFMSGISPALPSDDHPALAMDPGANILYVANKAAATLYQITVSGTTGSVDYYDIPIGDATSTSNPKGMAVSADGSTVYVTRNNDNKVTSLNAANNNFNAKNSATITSPFGAALTPDGTQLYITETTGGTNTAVVNTSAFTTAPTLVSVGQGSETTGNFMGP